MTSDIRVRITACDHSCGGAPIRYATPGVTGFRCARCGAEVADLSSAKPQSPPSRSGTKTIRRYF